MTISHNFSNLPSKGGSTCPDGGAEGAVTGLILPVSPRLLALYAHNVYLHM